MTWNEFTTIIHGLVTVDARRLGIATGRNNFLDLMIRQAVLEVQSFIDFYKQGHETTYGADDLTQMNMASAGVLPPDCEPLDCYHARVGKPCARQPIWPYDWQNRNDLVCGSAKVFNNQFWMAIDPAGKGFLTYPRVDDDHQLILTYNGLKLEFEDADQVPFDEEMALAIAEFCKAKVSREVDHDIGLHDSYLKTYLIKRRELFANAKTRTSLNWLRPSLQPDPMCANQRFVCQQANTLCSKELVRRGTCEFIAFGNSGEPTTIANTIAVANLVKSLEPDFIIHLGNVDYPAGDPVTLQDNFIKFYSQFLPDKLYLAWGDKDFATDGGVALLQLLSTVSVLNGGKKYYDWVDPTNRVHFFVLNSGNASGGGEPDGFASNSIQGQFIQERIEASTLWNIVFVHKSPYTSDVVNAYGNTVMRWPFKDWGAHMVISAGGNNYERILVDTVPYIVSGLGGAPKTGFASPTVTGSQYRYNTMFGALYVTADDERLQVTFYDILGNIVDSLTVLHDESPEEVVLP